MSFYEVVDWQEKIGGNIFLASLFLPEDLIFNGQDSWPKGTPDSFFYRK